MKGLDFYYHIQVVLYLSVLHGIAMGIYYLMLLCSIYFTGKLRKHQCMHVKLDSSLLLLHACIYRSLHHYRSTQEILQFHS